MAEGSDGMTRKIAGTMYLLLLVVVIGLIAIPWVLSVVAELVSR